MPKLLNAIEDLAPLLADAKNAFVTGCASEISGLSDAIASSGTQACISGIFLPGINTANYAKLATNASVKSYFMTPQLRDGAVNYCPWRYRDIINFYLSTAMDVAVVMLSAPNDAGICSYGVTSDYSPLVLPKARIKVGVLNRQMPFIYGESIALSELDYILEIDQALIDTINPIIDDTSRTIADYIAGFIDDGATLQLGLGSIPGAVASAIGDRRQLKIRSGLIESNALTLDAQGALCQETAILGGVALGSDSYYQALHLNERVSFRSAAHTHNVHEIAATDSFIAINGALEVDVFGQVNSSVLPSGYMSGPGGLPEFVAGALGSKKGRSIIALNASAKSGTVSKIVASLTGGLPSIALCDVDTVVTEFGIAELRGKPLAQRVQAMINIADPAHRPSLIDATKSIT